MLARPARLAGPSPAALSIAALLVSPISAAALSAPPHRAGPQAPSQLQDDSWTQRPGSQSWYLLTASSSWYAAGTQAGLVGAQLATIADDAEQQWLLGQLVGPGPYWLGGWQDVSALDYSEPAGGWTWVTGEAFAYAAWAPGEPSDVPAGSAAALALVTGGSPGWVAETPHAQLAAVFELESDDCDGNGVPDEFQVKQGWTDPCLPLAAKVQSVRISTGGVQPLVLKAGPQPLGSLYFLVGSETGTSPGLSIDGLLLPLNFDDYTTFMIENPNSIWFQNTLGSLLPDGTPPLDVQIGVPPGLPATLAGKVLHHAFVVFEVLTGTGHPHAVFTSNAVELKLIA